MTDTPITLADVRAHIEERIQTRVTLAREQILDTGVCAEVCDELREILAMLERVQPENAR